MNSHRDEYDQRWVQPTGLVAATMGQMRWWYCFPDAGSFPL